MRNLTIVASYSGMAVMVHIMPQDVICCRSIRVGTLFKRPHFSHHHVLGVVGYDDAGYGPVASERKKIGTSAHRILKRSQLEKKNTNPYSSGLKAKQLETLVQRRHTHKNPS